MSRLHVYKGWGIHGLFPRRNHSSNMYANERHTYQTLPASEPYAAGESLLDVSIRTISVHIRLMIVYIGALFSFGINIHGIDIVSVATMSAVLVAISNIVDISPTLPNLEGMSSTIQTSNSEVPRPAAGSKPWGGQCPPMSYLPSPRHNLDQCVASHHTQPIMRHTLDGGQDMCVT